MNGIFEYRNLEYIKNKKIAIFGCGGISKEFAIRLASEDIYFDYFLFPDDEEGWDLPKLYNKRIININECKQIEDIVVISPYTKLLEVKSFLEKHNMTKIFVQIEYIKDVVADADNVIIYGTGSGGKRVYDSYSSVVKISYFCDSNKDKAGEFFCGKVILNPEELNRLNGDTVILIASVAGKEIVEILNKYEFDIKRIYNCTNCLMLDNSFDRKHGIAMSDLGDLLFDIKRYKNIVYGEKSLAVSFTKKMEIFDVKIDKTIVRENITEDGTIFNLMYEKEANSRYIILDQWSQDIIDAIRKMDIDFRHVICITYFYLCVRLDPILDETYLLEEEFLDPLLGVSIGSKEDEIFSWKKYEYVVDSNKDKPIIILTLGGSTTTGYRLRNRSWCEFLSLILKQKGVSHVIYNGGIESYNVTLELLKFLRDGIWMKPDIVINYSGINNCADNCMGTKCSFLGGYQEMLYEVFYENRDKSKDLTNNMAGINYGLDTEKSRFTYWYKYTEIIHSICEKYNIFHKTFLQPSLLSKKNITSNDKDAMFIMYNMLIKNNQWNIYNPDNEKQRWGDYTSTIYWAKEFRKRGREIANDWFVDLTGIFDDMDYIYMDLCHVYEEGNKIIAQKIFKEIESVL